MDDKKKMVILGHIDHGVTTMIDKLKEMDVKVFVPNDIENEELIKQLDENGIRHDGSVRDMSNDLIDKSLKTLSEIKKENESFLIHNPYKDLDEMVYGSPIIKPRKQNNTKHKPRKRKSKSFGKNKKK